jgi:hypothetical protein
MEDEMTSMKEIAAPKKVLVECHGIITKTGFNVYPPRMAPVFVEFEPNKTTAMESVVAEYLKSMDPQKFKIVGSETDAPVAPDAKKKK